MIRVIILGLGSLFTMGCSSLELSEVCKGEWSYMINDTTYCELLINDSIVFPYHYNHRNGYACRYQIINDTFYLFGNKKNIVEMSPINYLGRDSFQILGITPHTLKRVTHKDPANQSLARYFYKLGKLSAGKTVSEKVEQNIYAEMNDYRKIYEETFHERRTLALYKIANPKQNN